MKMSLQLVAVLVSLAAFYQSAAAADKPSDVIVGKWKDRAEPSDAVISFAKDGAGTITATKSDGAEQAIISWKMTGIYGNACIVDIKYDAPKSKDAKELPKEAKPLTWLIVFDGKDRFITQPIANKIVIMQRQ
jgi:spermidine/putrescine-binding protein